MINSTCHPWCSGARLLKGGEPNPNPNPAPNLTVSGNGEAKGDKSANVVIGVSADKTTGSYVGAGQANVSGVPALLSCHHGASDLLSTHSNFEPFTAACHPLRAAGRGHPSRHQD